MRISSRSTRARRSRSKGIVSRKQRLPHCLRLLYHHRFPFSCSVVLSMTTTVHNLRYERMRPGDIRIDRRTEFGNEFVIGHDGTREEVIAKFEAAERARLAFDGGRRYKV